MAAAVIAPIASVIASAALPYLVEKGTSLAGEYGGELIGKLAKDALPGIGKHLLNKLFSDKKKKPGVQEFLATQGLRPEHVAQIQSLEPAPMKPPRINHDIPDNPIIAPLQHGDFDVYEDNQTAIQDQINALLDAQSDPEALIQEIMRGVAMYQRKKPGRGGSRGRGGKKFSPYVMQEHFANVAPVNTGVKRRRR